MTYSTHAAFVAMGATQGPLPCQKLIPEVGGTGGGEFILLTLFSIVCSLSFVQF
jgi:hypothetical protein